MKEFFASYPLLAWSLVSFMLGLIAVSMLWEKLKWWWLNTWYSFPLIGKTARLSKILNRDIDTGWFKAERTLCRDYKTFITIQDEHDFLEKKTYLKKAGDLGRSETPLGIWLLTIALVFVEAMGFSYVLAGWALPGSSENLQQQNAYGIAFMVSVILVGFTHFAGKQLYRSLQIRRAINQWQDQSQAKENLPLTTGTIGLHDRQDSDDKQPGYVQMTNRIGSEPYYIICYLAAAFIIAVAIGATYVRGQVLEKQLQHEVTGLPASTAPLPADALNMNAPATLSRSQLPGEDVQQAAAADQKARNDEASIDRKGGWGTFIMLAVIFVFLQVLSTLFGFIWGFANKESKKAHESTGKGRYATYADVHEHYQRIADATQAQLENLQQKLMHNKTRRGQSGANPQGTFRAFMAEERHSVTRDRANERQHTAQRAIITQTPIAPLAQQENLPVQNAPCAPPAAAAQAEASTCEAILEKMSSLHDKASKQQYLSTLPTHLRDEVIARLKANKETQQRQEDEIRARQASELDDLLD